MSKDNPYSNYGYIGYGMYSSPNEEVGVVKAICTTLTALWAIITMITTGMMVATDSIMWCIVAAMCGASTIFSAFVFAGIVNIVKSKSLAESMARYPMD